MYNPNADLVTLDEIKRVRHLVNASENYRRTPTLHHVQKQFNIQPDIDLHLKLESMQVTGSFKVRGLLNQLRHVPPGVGTPQKPLVTLSAGNYGKAFAFLAQQQGLTGVVFLPETAPVNRARLIEGYGVKAIRAPPTGIMDTLDKYIQDNNAVFLHSFDDASLFPGYGSLGLEILEEVPDPDVVLVCCGGGALVAGTAAGIKLSGHKNCRIYAIEPEGSRTMYESFKQGRAVSMQVRSVASGLSPPAAGPNSYKHCRRFVDDVILVSDAEIIKGMFTLYKGGLVVEPSGAAAFAALLHNKIPNVSGKKVVVVVTGGNITPEELMTHSQSARL